MGCEDVICKFKGNKGVNMLKLRVLGGGFLMISGSSLAKIVEQCVIKNRVQYIHCR